MQQLTQCELFGSARIRLRIGCIVRIHTGWYSLHCVVVRQNNMFNDPTEAINELAALVKNDITDINVQLDNLQVCACVLERMNAPVI
jgi:hypothetical protein